VEKVIKEGIIRIIGKQRGGQGRLGSYKRGRPGS
jgi:hypothetical protein